MDNFETDWKNNALNNNSLQDTRLSVS